MLTKNEKVSAYIRLGWRSKKNEESPAIIRDLELQLATLMEEAEKDHSEKEIKLNKKKGALRRRS